MKAKRIGGYALASLIMLTACARRTDNTERTTAAETTTLTLTESFTREYVPEPEPEPVKIDFAVFDPFSDNVMVSGTVLNELSEAAEKISDGYGFRLGGMSAFHYNSKYMINYSDEENPLEVNDEEEYTYTPLYPEIAQTEEELFEYLRGCFTEDFVSDEQLRKDLFEPEHEHSPQLYKTIDGVLCIRHKYMGVYDSIAFDEMTAVSYDGDEAEIMTGVSGASDDGNVFFLKLKKSEEYGWRLDALDRPFYDKNAVNSVYTLSQQIDTLNSIFDGSPDENSPADIDGETYYPANTGMDMRQMKEYFALIFSENILSADGSDTGVPLRDAYTEKYIDNVYRERNGKLYRKASAPRLYLSEMYVDLHTSASKNWSQQWNRHVVEIKYNDDDGNIVIEYSCVPEDSGEVRTEYARFASELPVKAKE